jgi:hexosaminidase
MKLTKLALTAVWILSGTAICRGAKPPSGAPAIIPWPAKIAVNGGTLKLKNDLKIAVSDPSLQPLAAILVDEINAVAGLHAATSDAAATAGILLKISPGEKGEAYKLSVDDKITVTGADYQSVAEGTATILQSIATKAGSAEIAKMTITDKADTDYRGLMIDLAREFHPVSKLQQIVEMCRVYKIRYLHLHLSDDQSFTFPSTAYPQMATTGRSYSHDEMTVLVKFSQEHGVTIVPEIDMPAHASSIIKAMPELSSPAGNIINFADPKGITAACTLVDEMAEMFPQSPYIHVGGDEANLGPLVSDPAFVKAINDQNVGDIGGLFNYFLNQLDDRVKSHGKRMIAWEGFSVHPSGPAQVNPDVIVEPFDNYRNAETYYVAAGHDLINTSWFPLYVLHDCLFGPKSIYDWDVYTFGNYRGFSPRNYEDVTQYKVTTHEKVLGAQMCSWEQGPATEIPTLRRRLPAMSERAWNRAAGLPYEDFIKRLDATDQMLSVLLATQAPGPVMAAATDSVYADRVAIQWNAGDEYPTKYTVLRGTTDDAASAVPIATDIHATQFADRTADKGTKYFYWVKARNRFGYGPADKPSTGSRGTSAKVVSAYEGFNNAFGPTFAGTTGGQGWAGPWEVTKADATISFKKEGLTYPGLKTSGGCFNVQFANDKDMIDLHRSTIGTQGVPGTQMWMSYLIRANKIGDGHFLVESDASKGAGVGKQWGNGICVFPYATNVALVAGKTCLVVARYDCMAAGHDAVYVWVNPALDKEPDVNAPGVAISTSAWSSTGTKFKFSSQGYGSGNYDFDELRLGSSWQDVLPRK